MAKSDLRRPLLTAEDRARLRRMAAKATANANGPNRAYCKGVSDVLAWIADNEEMTPLLREVTR